MKKLKYTKDDIIKIVDNYTSYASLLKALNLAPKGGNYTRLKALIKNNNINIEHFLGHAWRRNRNFKLERLKPEKILVKNSTYSSGVSRSSTKIKKLILDLKLKEEICENCYLQQWLNVKIPLELHHLDGDNKNNEIANLRLLCPNCHSLTDNYRGRNIK